jgi:hypothetical protein
MAEVGTLRTRAAAVCRSVTSEQVMLLLLLPAVVRDSLAAAAEFARRIAALSVDILTFQTD